MTYDKQFTTNKDSQQAIKMDSNLYAYEYNPDKVYRISVRAAQFGGGAFYCGSDLL